MQMRQKMIRKKTRRQSRLGREKNHRVKRKVKRDVEIGEWVFSSDTKMYILFDYNKKKTLII